MSVYQGTKKISQIRVISDPLNTSDATATSSDILLNKTAYAKGEKITGTIESLAEQEYIPTIEDISIPLGKYLSGNQILKGSPNLLPGNIKKGVEIFGVTGTFEGSGGSVKKGTILDTTTSTSQQDTLNNWGNKCYIKDGDLDWMTFNDIVAHWGGVASQNNFIGGESEKYGIYMTNWSEQEKNTSILFIEPINIIAGDLLLVFNCNISS